MKCHACGYDGAFESLNVRSQGRDSVFFTMSAHRGDMGVDSYRRMPSRRDGLCACPKCGIVRIDAKLDADSKAKATSGKVATPARPALTKEYIDAEVMRGFLQVAMYEEWPTEKRADGSFDHYLTRVAFCAYKYAAEIAIKAIAERDELKQKLEAYEKEQPK